MVGVSDERVQEISKHTRSDEVLQAVINSIQKGWPLVQSDFPSAVKPYFPIRGEKAVDQGVIFKDARCLVPKSLRSNHHGTYSHRPSSYCSVCSGQENVFLKPVRGGLEGVLSVL